MKDIKALARMVDERLEGPLSPVAVAAVLREVGRHLSDTEVLRVFEGVERMRAADYAGLRDLMADPEVTSIHITGDDVYVNGDPGGVGWSGTDDGELRRLAQRLAASSPASWSGGGRRLDESTPYVDCRLPDGTRLRAYVGQHGLPFTMRLDKNYPYTLEERVELGLLTRSAAEFLEGEGL